MRKNGLVWVAGVLVSGALGCSGDDSSGGGSSGTGGSGGAGGSGATGGSAGSGAAGGAGGSGATGGSAGSGGSGATGGQAGAGGGTGDCGESNNPCVVEVGVAQSGSLVADTGSSGPTMIPTPGSFRVFTFTPAAAGAYTLTYTGTVELSYHQEAGQLICVIDPSGLPADKECCDGTCTVTMHDVTGGPGTPLLAGHAYYIQMYAGSTAGDYDFTITGP